MFVVAGCDSEARRAAQASAEAYKVRADSANNEAASAYQEAREAAERYELARAAAWENYESAKKAIKGSVHMKYQEAQLATEAAWYKYLHTNAKGGSTAHEALYLKHEAARITEQAAFKRSLNPPTPRNALEAVEFARNNVDIVKLAVDYARMARDTTQVLASLATVAAKSANSALTANRAEHKALEVMELSRRATAVAEFAKTAAEFAKGAKDVNTTEFGNAVRSAIGSRKKVP